MEKRVGGIFTHGGTIQEVNSRVKNRGKKAAAELAASGERGEEQRGRGCAPRVFAAAFSPV